VAALEELLRQADSQHGDVDRRAITLRLARIRRERGEVSLCADLLESYSADHPDDGEVLASLAQLYEQREQPDALAHTLLRQLALVQGPEQAGDLARRLLTLLPRISMVMVVKAALERAHVLHGEPRELEEALIATLAFVQDHRAIAGLLTSRAMRAEADERAHILERAAQHWLQAGALAEAIDVLVMLRTSHPARLDTALVLADTLLREQRFADARTLVHAVMECKVKTAPQARALLLVRLARAAQGEGDSAAALDAMLAARDADKTNRDALAEVARMAEQANAWDVAEKALTSLILLKEADAMPRAELLLRRARVARVLNGEKQALLWARKALEEAKDSAEAAELVRALERALQL
jgi:hypothetical protein